MGAKQTRYFLRARTLVVEYERSSVTCSPPLVNSHVTVRSSAGKHRLLNLEHLSRAVD